ncbi:MAG TPA: hypothetical protein VEI01_00660 [Terriglobales bacterium]|nr:hypothetical protein [Terriglobales bacterium]
MGIVLATAARDRALIEAVANEIAAGIECALEFWMIQFESVLQDPRLTTLGRLNAVREIVNNYRQPMAEGAHPTGGYAA